MSGLVIFIFIAIIALRFVVSTLKTNQTQSKTTLTNQQLRTLAERLKAATLSARASNKPPPPGWRPPGQPVPPAMTQPPAYPPPVYQPPAPAPPPATVAPVTRSEPEQDLSSSLDTSLSTSLTSSALDDNHQILAGPQVIALPPDLQRRVMEYMDQNYEVMAVRLVCDEMHVGILDAHKTVRTLAGLPTL